MPLTQAMRTLLLLFFLSGAAQSPLPACGAEPVKIGVLAFRPKQQALAQWQPLAVALKQALPEYDFVVETFTYPELDQAVAYSHLDFVLTNAGHYVLLAKRNRLSSPLATLDNNENDRSTTVFGGVIFTRAGRTDINTLRDIKRRSVAAVAAESLGGYQVQARELLRAGIRLPQDVKLFTTGMPHDKVIETVLTGHADVGFVRCGVLEGMEREGKLDLKQLKILNRQTLPGFPLQVSTRLYPEWSFAAMPHTDENLAKRVAATLFLLEDNKEATRAMGIHGFVVPADYSPVEDLLRELRLPPFEVMPAFTHQDVWSRYRWEIMGALLAFGIIVILGAVLLITLRRLTAKHQLVLLQQRALQENEEKFRTVADHTLGWEYWEGPRHELLYMSPSCEQITGYSRAEFLADPDLLMRIIHPDDREQTEAHRHDIDNQEDGVLDFRIVRRDGSIRWVAHLCHPVWSSDGIFKGRRISNRDITERKHLETEKTKLEMQYHQLQKSESLGRMAGAIAHNFNNALGAVIGNLELSMDTLPPDAQSAKFLDEAMKAARRAAEVSGMMRIYLGQTASKLEPLDLSEACRNSLPLLMAALPKEVHCEVDFASPGPTIEANAQQIQQVLNNLATNAWEAFDAGRGTMHLAVKTVSPADIPEAHRFPLEWQPRNNLYACLEVSDSGCGIAEQVIDLLFDPFFTTKFTGRGLGLPVVLGIVRAHHGAVTVESEPGKGSTFRIFLPAIVAQVEKMGY